MPVDLALLGGGVSNGIPKSHIRHAESEAKKSILLRRFEWLSRMVKVASEADSGPPGIIVDLFVAVGVMVEQVADFAGFVDRRHQRKGVESNFG